MPTQSDITQQMLQALSLAEPALDTSIGSTIRSILDVVAETVAEAYGDLYLLSYQYAINTKSGADLDNFVAQFGFTRNPGTLATGSVTFSRTSNAVSDIYIAAGTQVADSNTPPDIFNTLTPVILAQGTNSCSVPIQAQIAGTAGNVAANTITNCTTDQQGFSTVTNPNGLAGGTNPESDDQLRARFIATVFRALTGTVAMFEAVGLDNPDVSLVNVIGATKTWNEMVEIVDGDAFSSVPDMKYFYFNTISMGTDIFNGILLTPGVDYNVSVFDVSMGSPGLGFENTGGSYAAGQTVSYKVTAVLPSGESLPGSASSGTTVSTGGNHGSVHLSLPTYDYSPYTTIVYNIYLDLNGAGYGFLASTTEDTYVDTGTITPSGSLPVSSEAVSAPQIIVADGVPDGLYEVQFDYLPASSRNDPNQGITNRVDIYCNNQNAVEATQDSQYTTANVFNNNSGDPLNVTAFQRLDGTNPLPGNYFIPFYFTPLISASSPTGGELVIGAHTYQEGTDFWTVNNITAFGNGPLSASGIEFSNPPPVLAAPTDGTAMSLDYVFNDIPTSVQTAVQTWALCTTDVMVHQAMLLELNFYFGIILQNASYSQSSVLSQIVTALSNYVNSLAFDSVVQVSEILAIVQGVPGVVAVRLLTSNDVGLVVYPTNPQADGENYAIQSVNDDNEVITTYALNDGSVSRAIDIQLNDDTLAAVNNVYISFLAQNTFGSV